MADDPAHEPGRILVGKSDIYQYLTLALGNRHGLVAGATGTGKTVTLQVLAEGFSRAGTAVFAADIKGDLAGIAMPGDAKPHFVQRAKEIGIAYEADDFPVTFWDLFGQTGHPVRARISDMGPLLLARLLELNDVQEGVFNIAFRLADEQGLLLIDLKDFRALLQHLGDTASEVTKSYGNVAPATIGAIQRRLLVLENQGAADFFGEPELDINDFLRSGPDGRGIVNILSAEKLMRSPRLYAIFLLWMLSELFEKLPEVGDLDKPKLVFFFDEAHLLFDNAPKGSSERHRAGCPAHPLEGRRRLFRHPKSGRRAGDGSGTTRQSRSACLARLHAARPEGGQSGGGYVPPEPLLRYRRRDHRARRSAKPWSRCSTPRAIPKSSRESLIAPPMARVGPISDEERQQLLQKSRLLGKYETAIDRQSAFETLRDRSQPGEPPGGVLGGWLARLARGRAWRAIRQDRPAADATHVDGRNRASLRGSVGRADGRDERSAKPYCAGSWAAGRDRFAELRRQPYRA